MTAEFAPIEYPQNYTLADMVDDPHLRGVASSVDHTDARTAGHSEQIPADWHTAGEIGTAMEPPVSSAVVVRAAMSMNTQNGEQAIKIGYKEGVPGARTYINPMYAGGVAFRAARTDTEYSTPPTPDMDAPIENKTWDTDSTQDTVVLEGNIFTRSGEPVEVLNATATTMEIPIPAGAGSLADAAERQAHVYLAKLPGANVMQYLHPTGQPA